MYSFLLPFFEEQNVFNELDFSVPWDESRNRDLTHGIQLSMLECPSAPGTRRHKYTSGRVEYEDNSINHVADYAPSWYLDARRTRSQMSTVSQRVAQAGILQLDTLNSLVPTQILTSQRGLPTRSGDDPQNQKWWGIMQMQEGAGASQSSCGSCSRRFVQYILAVRVGWQARSLREWPRSPR